MKAGYREIVQRHSHRYEVTHNMAGVCQRLVSSAGLMALIHSLLGEDAVVVHSSLVVSMAGAEGLVLLSTIE